MLWTLLLVWGVLATLSPPPPFVVTLHDLDQHPVVGAVITVYADSDDSADAAVLATTTTDATGTAQLRNLPTDSVRVAVRGDGPDGIALHQIGDDEHGVRIHLRGAGGALLLRVDAAGAVVIDPVSWSAEAHIALPQPIVPPPPQGVTQATRADVEDAAHSSWGIVVALVALGMAAAVVLLVARQNRRAL